MCIRDSSISDVERRYTLRVFRIRYLESKNSNFNKINNRSILVLFALVQDFLPRTAIPIGVLLIDARTLEESGPVSYTHLDVYKRQGYSSPSECLEKERNEIRVDYSTSRSV